MAARKVPPVRRPALPAPPPVRPLQTPAPAEPDHIRRRPAAPPHVATPNAKPSSSSASVLDTASTNAHRTTDTDLEDAILPPPAPAKKRTVLPTASTAPKADLYVQFTLLRFSIGQLLEEDLPLSLYDMQAQAAGAAPRGRRRAVPTRAPRVLSGHVLGGPHARAKDAPRRARAQGERVNAQTHLIHTLALADLVQLTNTGLPPTAATKTRVLLARFSVSASSSSSTPTHPISTLHPTSKTHTTTHPHTLALSVP
ncbi:hypothetical protein K438DRAFT_1960269 [Mycena galopus ATCC 62051]|nr:hypothetical protein K438DRAFT_1960269 [Mycena galopus ATCC 62051]